MPSLLGISNSQMTAMSTVATIPVQPCPLAEAIKENASGIVADAATQVLNSSLVKIIGSPIRQVLRPLVGEKIAAEGADKFGESAPLVRGLGIVGSVASTAEAFGYTVETEKFAQQGNKRATAEMAANFAGAAAVCVAGAVAGFAVFVFFGTTAPIWLTVGAVGLAAVGVTCAWNSWGQAAANKAASNFMNRKN